VGMVCLRLLDASPLLIPLIFVSLSMSKNEKFWWKRWALWQKMVVKEGDDIYLYRRTVLKTPILSFCIHWIYRSDGDRCLHDHPWSFLSIVLRGEYIEYRRKKHTVNTVPSTRGFLSIAYRRSKSLHRVVLPQHQIKPVITFVIMGRSKRDWGFETKLGWVKWDKYLEHGPKTRNMLCKY